MNGYYPVILQLKGKCCVVFGGGVVAERKLKGLIEAGADHVVVISPSVIPSIEAMAASKLIQWNRRTYAANDVRQAWIVFAATDDRDVNASIAGEAERLGILVNRSDEAENGSFISPSIVRRGDLIVAVTASGASPALAQRIKSELEQQYGASYETATRRLRQLREKVLERIHSESDKRAILKLASEDALAFEDSNKVNMGIEEWLGDLMARIKGGNQDGKVNN